MSPDLRKRFEQVGETALYVALGSGHHSEPFKDFPDLRNDQIRAAALQWLAESRELAAQRQRRRDLYVNGHSGLPRCGDRRRHLNSQHSCHQLVRGGLSRH